MSTAYALAQVRKTGANRRMPSRRLRGSSLPPPTEDVEAVDHQAPDLVPVCDIFVSHDHPSMFGKPVNIAVNPQVLKSNAMIGAAEDTNPIDASATDSASGVSCSATLSRSVFYCLSSA